MLELIAVDYQDAWGFVKDGSHTLLVRPPFNSPLEVSMDVVERAITFHNFTPSAERFSDWRELLDHLMTRNVELRSSHMSQPSGEDFLTLIRRAPKHVVSEELKKLEQNADKLEHSDLHLIESLLQNEAVVKDSGLLARISKLSIAIAENTAREHSAGRLAPLISFPRLPYESDMARKVARVVSKRKQVFAVGAR